MNPTPETVDGDQFPGRGVGPAVPGTTVVATIPCG